MTKLHLLSLCLIGLSTPALAQISLTLPSGSACARGDQQRRDVGRRRTSDEPSDIR